jgi:hypothetical protein
MYEANNYKNVMELLVDDEIDRQTGHYTKEDAQSINRIEVATYALNRLPPLYASSLEGVNVQHKRGQEEFGDRLATAVTQALDIIHQHPLRMTTPISTPNEAVDIEAELTLARQDLEEIATWFQENPVS